MLVDDVDVGVVDRAPEWDALALRHAVHHRVHGVVGGLGEPVGVDHRDAGLGGEPALHELLLEQIAGGARRVQVRQRPGVLLQGGQDHVEVGRHHLQHRGPLVDDRVEEPVDVQDRLLLYEQGAAADQERADQLPDGDVEALRAGLGITSPSATARSSSLATMWLSMPACSHITPFGSPVEPEVNRT